MKLKTDIEIKALAKESAGEPLSDKDLIAQWKCYVGGYEKGYTQAQQDLPASASEGFEEWQESQIQRIIGMDEAVARDILEESMTPKRLWQAAKLSQAKEMQEKDAEIERLRRELRSSSESFNTLSVTDAQLIEELKKEIEELKKTASAWEQMYKDLNSRIIR